MALSLHVSPTPLPLIIFIEGKSSTLSVHVHEGYSSCFACD